MNRLISLLATAALAFSLAACAGDLQDPERFENGSSGAVDAGDDTGDNTGDECSDDIESELLATGCGTSVCHDADNPAAGLDLASPNVASRLVDVASGCGGQPLIDSSDVGNSYLLNKLTDSPACGAQMSPISGPLSQADIDCVRAWAEDQL